MTAKNLPRDSEMENRYEWTPVLIFTSTGSVTRHGHSRMPPSQPLASEAGLPSRDRRRQRQALLSLAELSPLPLSPSNPVLLSTQVWEERRRCQCLGTFLRNGLQPQVGTEFPWHINDCCVKGRHCLLTNKESGIYSCPKGWPSPGGNLTPECPS